MLKRFLRMVLISTLVLTFLFSGAVDAIEREGPGISGASFLRIDAGARATGMGGAYTALADDGYGMYWNPAGISRLEHSTFSATSMDIVLDISNQFLSVGLPLSPNYTMAMSSRFIKIDDTRRTERKTTGEFSNRDASLAMHYAYGGRYGLAAGIGVKAIHQELADISATNFAIDGGFHYRAKDYPLSFGLSAQNIGSDIKFKDESDPLPTTFRMGVAYGIPLWYSKLILSTDIVNFHPDRTNSLRAGMELEIIDSIALRGGYEKPLDFGESRFHAGVGIDIYGFALDYSFSDKNLFGEEQKFSFTLKF